MEDAGGFVRQMANVTPVERNTDVLRPYGVFACIAPFNFPLALSTGMSSAALVAGNTVVYKPAEDAPWTGLKLYEVYRDAGLPGGAFNYLSGHGSEAGEALWRHRGVDGVVFTGSKDVGLKIHQGLSNRWIKPCLLELGGKNAAIVMETADLDAAAEGVARSVSRIRNAVRHRASTYTRTSRSPSSRSSSRKRRRCASATRPSAMSPLVP